MQKKHADPQPVEALKRLILRRLEDFVPADSRPEKHAQAWLSELKSEYEALIQKNRWPKYRFADVVEDMGISFECPEHCSMEGVVLAAKVYLE